jgi:hypothetical protein
MGHLTNNGLTIPKSVTSIGQEAFAYMYDVTGDLIFEGGGANISIGVQAFYYADFDGALIIPATVTSVDNRAFMFASKFTELKFDGFNSQPS